MSESAWLKKLRSLMSWASRCGAGGPANRWSCARPPAKTVGGAGAASGAEKELLASRGLGSSDSTTTFGVDIVALS